MRRSLASLTALLPVLVPALATALFVAPGPAAAADAPAPRYGVRLYELFEIGPELRLSTRTSKAWEPHNAREIVAGETFPAEGQPAIKVAKMKGHRAFVGGVWREDGTTDLGAHSVLVTEEGGDAGYALVRVKIVDRAEVVTALHAGDDAGKLGAKSVPAAEVQGALFGARLYELLHRGDEVVLQERTTRAFGPANVRNLPLQATWPLEGQPGIEVAKSRGTLGYFGSTWREDGAGDKDLHRVAVFEEGGLDGTAMTRIRIAVVPATTAPAPLRRDGHPSQS